MDSFEINKIIGAVLLTALIVIGLGKFTDFLFYIEKPKQSAYKIEGLENFETSEPIQTANGILILMIKDKKKISKKISFEDELQTMLNMEAENQLNQFSQIFFKKIELNTKIYEK